MVVKTNRYVTQEINKQRLLRQSSHFKDWKSINSEHMRQFLGVLLHMGCVKMPSLEHYWSKNSLYRVPLLSRIMPPNKFQLMLRFWHFINYTDSGSGRLCKTIGLLDHLINTMDNIYCPNKNISMDETTLAKHLLDQMGAIVLDLMEKFLGKVYHLYTVNLYNSFELTKHMINQKTCICGTLRTDQKSNPKECLKAKLKQGDIISRSREGVVVAKWKDKTF
ncbi:piggyBac transposable element-derived protein 4-like [Hydra vulgaris]|uniref:PiggyBac transposable element-derived protein 4-like n=1 Tax=Hydra vulgaris TaxID=6087 RepID=A0ABM4B8Y9_HYDVU